jgi:hypothetical protein
VTAVRAPERAGRSVEGVATGLVGALVFLIAVRPAIDNDLWFHLRTGRWMLDHHRWVGPDPFTHTRPGVVRVQTDWLADLLFHGVWRWAGLAGLALLVAALATAAMLILFRTIEGSVPVRAGVVLLAAAASSIFWSARPQMLTFLGTVVVGAVLRVWRREPARALVWWLVPLVLVWTNVHGGVVYGLLIILGTVAGEWANRGFGLAQPLDRAALHRLTLVAAACVAVMVANPSGLRVYGLPFHQVSSSVRFVQEVQPPSLGDPTAWPFFLLLGLTVALMARHWRALDLVELVLVAGSAALALQFTRSIPFFAVVTAPVVTRLLRSGPPMPRPNAEEGAQNARWGVVGLAVVAAMGVTVVKLEPDGVQQRLEAEYPVQAVDWIEANEPPHELFNTFDWGGYLMWELPWYRVSIDGRTDVYDDFLDTYAATIGAAPGWAEELDREGIGTVLVAPGDPLATALRSSAGWDLRYEDPVAVVFVRRS